MIKVYWKENLNEPRYICNEEISTLSAIIDMGPPEFVERSGYLVNCSMHPEHMITVAHVISDDGKIYSVNMRNHKFDRFEIV